MHVLLNFTEKLLEVLYLQLDSPGSQHKNRYVFGFCAFLVESQVFRKFSHSSVIICTSNCSYYMRHSYLSINYSACGHNRVYMCIQLCAFFYSHTVLYFLLSCLLLCYYMLVSFLRYQLIFFLSAILMKMLTSSSQELLHC